MIVEKLGRNARFFLPLALLLLALNLTFSLRLWQKFGTLSSSIRVNTDVLDHTERLLIAMEDAETGQRGFLLTGRDEYLRTYDSGAKQAPEELATLRQAARTSPEQRPRVEAIVPLVSQKLKELRLTIELMKSSGAGAALIVVNSDAGKRSMDALRDLCGRIQVPAHLQLARNALGAEESLRQGIAVTTTGSVLVFALLAVALKVIGRANRQRDGLMGESHERGRLLEIRTVELQQLLADKTKTEERFQLVVEASPSAMIMVGANGLITLINSQTEKLFGYTRRELLGRSLEILIPERFRAVHRSHRSGFFAAPAARSMGADRNLFGLCRDGSEVPIEIGLNPIASPDGQFVLASIIDITERKRVSAELQSKAAELERFTYTVSHDLKSPLITIKSYVAMIDRDLAGGSIDRARSDLTRVAKAADKMNQLLEELLALSCVGRVENAQEKVLFGSLVEEALELVAGGIQDRHVHVQVAPNLPSVTVDRRRMVEVLQNLIDNASKFMGGQAAPEILVGASNEGAETRFFVKDNGVGVEPRHHERIFGLFDKLDPKSGGSGAGLAIVKRIIETHGGRIWINSQGTGGGSTFWFTLKAVEGNQLKEIK
jgi:two-component system sensor kinase FixL